MLKALRNFITPVPLDQPTEERAADMGMWETLSVGYGGGMPDMSQDKALQIAAVWSCVRVISESLASLPLELFEEQADGSIYAAKDQPLYKILNSEPNDHQTSFTFRECMMTQLSLAGNAYAKIRRDGSGAVKSLEYIPSNAVNTVLKSGNIYYIVTDISQQGALTTKVPARDMLHIPGLSLNGYTGLSPLSYARNTLQFGASHQEYGSAFFKNGARLSGVLETDHKLSETAWQRLRRSWQQLYSGADNAGKTAILEEGMKFHQISISPEDAKYLETGRLLVEDIARIFRVPLHMIGNLDRATFNNIEHLSMNYVTYTLRPWIKRFEQEMNRKLLIGSDKEKYFIRFNIKGLLRGDSTARADFYQKLWQMGAMNPNEIRKLEDMNPYEGGGEYYKPMNFQDINSEDEIQ